MLSWIGFFCYFFKVFFNFWGRGVGGGGISFFMCGGRDLGGGVFFFNVCNVLSFKL